MKNKIFENLDPSMQMYFKDRGLQEKDFWCTNCGNCLVELSDLKKYKYVKTQNSNKSYLAKFNGKKFKAEYVEPSKYRWFLHGKYLSVSNKTVYRHICWDCFFKLLPTIVDIRYIARQSKWYKRIENGEKPIPLRNVSSSDYFKLLFYLSDEEIKNEKKKLATASLDWFTNRYGKEEGEKRFKVYCERQAYTCSKEYMQKTRGYTDEQWKAFNANRAVTKANLISRYGEKEGLERWQKYCEYEAYAGCSLQYFIDKYGQIDGKKKYLELNAKKSITMENFVKKYGFELGKEKFNNIRNKPYSMKSQILFEAIDKKLGDFAKDSKYALKNTEATIELHFDDGTCRVCHPDYVLNDKIIEFNGDYWHANPKFYEPDEEVKMNNTTILAKELWNKDKCKIDGLNKQGYKTMVVWEDAYDCDYDAIVERCIKFLKG